MHDGDVTAGTAPVHAAVWLFGCGLLYLIGRAGRVFGVSVKTPYVYHFYTDPKRPQAESDPKETFVNYIEILKFPYFLYHLDEI